MNDKIFREQITEDINLIQENLSWDSNISKNEYAFNYWVLSNLYSLDEEVCNTNITEYNDKGIDCFVHHKEDKELYIIQNKYYSEATQLNNKEVSDFLTRPIASLEEGKYKNSELQKIYNQAKNENYTIFLHFYITNNLKSQDITNIIDNFTNQDIIAEIFYLDDIKEKYYEESFKDTKQLNATIKVKNKGTYLAIRPNDYDLPNMSEAYYVMAKVYDIYQLWHMAKNDNYELFGENIREYLGGTGSINKQITNTLNNPDERGNFFYYNNGITIICDSADADAQKVEIKNPQIVNGCQTVNSIAEALRHYSNSENDFKDVYVMAKILVLERQNKDFYRAIVKYTNSQNSINEKVFGATIPPFSTIQGNIKKQGFLVVVKQSDKNTFREIYKDTKQKGKLLKLANKHSIQDFHQFTTISGAKNGIQIPLETLIQIIGAFKKDAHFSYTKKSSLLRPSSIEYYQNFSTKIGNFFTVESMVKLIVLYKKSEYDKKNSEDKKSPSPYYLLNFLGCYLESRKIDKQHFLKTISTEQLVIVYNNFKMLSRKYYEAYKGKHKIEYNQMIKQKVDIDIMQEVLDEHFSTLNEYSKTYNLKEYEKLMGVFESV